MKEQELQKQILDWLKYQPGQYWRINSGAMKKEYKGKTHFVRFGAPGMSDIIGIHPKLGFVAIEVKIEDNKPTELQNVFTETINYWGGHAITAYSQEDVEKLFKESK